MEPRSRKALLWRELLEHLPFTIFFTAAGILVAGLLLYVAIVSSPVEDAEPDVAASESHESTGERGDSAEHATMPHNPHMKVASLTIFHLFHPLHLMLSAIATTAMFWRHEKRLLKAIMIGFIGSVGVCGLSDVFMPYLSGRLLAVEGMHFHWCLLEHPQMVLPFIFIGILCGVMAPGRIARSTQFSHSSHIFVSVVASLFYLISFGLDDWVSESVFPYVFLIVVVCVAIPCCISDILFPLLSVSCPDHECCPEHDER